VGLGDLFWIIFIVAALQPFFRQRLLEAARTRLIRDLERRRNSRVIALVHRQETMSLLGFPLLRYIDIEDSEEVLRAIQLTDPNVPIDFILHTPGGLVLAAEQIAHALVAHPAKVTIFVPHYAMSGGTLLALAADNIVMAPHAVLGPLDPQLDRFPAASILRAVESQKERNKDIEDQTLILADMAQKAMAQVRDFVARLLTLRKWDEAQAKKLAEVLTEGRWTHDYPITLEDARALGLPVSSDMAPEVYKFMRLFPQTATQRPSVQYIPLPYAAPPARSGSSTKR
jgi:ClpP class serine protease